MTQPDNNVYHEDLLYSEREMKNILTDKVHINIDLLDHVINAVI